LFCAIADAISYGTSALLILTRSIGDQARDRLTMTGNNHFLASFYAIEELAQFILRFEGAINLAVSFS
jgi:hypothetical protein